MRISDWSSDVCSSDLRTGDVVASIQFRPCSAGGVDAGWRPGKFNREVIMKKLFAAVATVAVIAASQALATDIIVVAHRHANDPFWSVVKNGVEKAAKATGVNVECRAQETFAMVLMGQIIDASGHHDPKRRT